MFGKVQLLIFTLETGSHAEADWLRVQVRSGAGRGVSVLSSLLPASENSRESRDFGPGAPSSLSTSRATRLGGGGG